MKKVLLVTSLAAAMGVVTSAEAAFTALVDGSYQMTITSGCFDYSNCQTSGLGAFTDNATANEATSAGFALDPNPPYGSGIVGDGLMGVINFSLTGGDISVTSFSQDSYLATAGGTFYIRAADFTNMGGSIDNAGNMNFDPTGRTALFAFIYETLGEQEWNRDNSTQASGVGTGLYEQWTTGTSTNRMDGITAGYSMTGSTLIDTGIAGEWAGTLVSAGNMGEAWGATTFSGTQYSELYNITITSTVPIPAAAWLFSSGLIGLIGLSRRKAHA